MGAMASATLSRLNDRGETSRGGARPNAAMTRAVSFGCFLAAILCNTAPLRADDTPRALMENGHFKRARALAERDYRAHPKDAETLWAMSRIRQEWHDLPAAMDFAEKALAANPKEARYHLQVAEVAGDLADQAGFMRQVSLGRRFKKEVDATVALDPNNIEALHDRVAYYFMAPGVIGGDKNKARQIAARIMQIDVLAGYRAQMQVAQFEKQQHIPYEEIYRKMVAARPDSYDARLSLGSQLMAQKKYDEAMEQARALVRLDGSRAGGHVLAAWAAAYQAKWAELDAALAQGEKDVPDDLRPYFRAANACLNTGAALPRAERYYRKYLSQEPEPDSLPPAVAHWRLGQALEKQGRRPEALEAWKMALQLDPKSPAREDLKRLQ